MVRFTKKMTVNSSADKVWKVFAHGFNDAYKWMASVPYSYAQSNGELFDGAQSDGRVCELTPKPDGMKASEKFVAYNEKEKTATVRIDFVNTPRFFPTKFNTLDFSIVDNGDGTSEMTWKFKSTLKAWGVFMWPALRKGFDVFVGQIMEELKHYVETGNPHPRKVKAINKLKAKQKAVLA